MNGQGNLSREPEFPAGTYCEDAVRLRDAARAGLGAGPDGYGWAEKLQVDPALGEQAVRDAAAEVLRARLDAWFARPGTPEEFWGKAKSLWFAPGIERRSNADAFFADVYLFIGGAIENYRAGRGYWASGRGHLFPVRPGPFGFARWITSNVYGAALRTRRGQEIGVDTLNGRHVELVPVDPIDLAELRDSDSVAGSQEWVSGHLLGELVACALSAAHGDQVLSYDLLRRPVAERDRTAQHVRSAAIAAINALSEAATLLPSLGGEGVKAFMTSPDRLSGAAIRATDGRERERAARDQHVKRTKPHVVFAVTAALEIAGEQAGPSADQDAQQVWDLATWGWRAAQLPQLSSMLCAAVRNHAGEQVAYALNTWSTELTETCQHPMRHRIVYDGLSGAVTAALSEAQKVLGAQLPGSPEPARAALDDHTLRLVDLQRRLSERADPANGTPPITDNTAITDNEGNLT